MRVLLVASTIFHDEVVESPLTGYEPHYCRDADDLAEFAGRLCYESWNRPNPDTATNQGYLANIISQGHHSVLEHASATFYIDGVSRNFTHELVRHRHLSFSEVSQRYVDVSKYRVVVPPALRSATAELDESEETAYYDPEAGTYDMDDTYAWHQYQATMEELSDLPRKEARQAARFCLPGGLETKILVTGNHRAWRDMLGKRLSPGADLEMRLVAQKILTELHQIAPNTYQDFGIPEVPE